MGRRLLAGYFFRLACVTAVLGIFAHGSHAQASPVSSKASAPPTQQGIFLVFPYENTGAGTRLDWLGEGLEELSIQRLSAAGQQVYSHEARLAELERYGLPVSARLSRATMLRVAEDLDADFVLFGSYSADDKSLMVTAHVLRVSPPALLPVVRVSGALDSLMDLHARLIWRFLSSNDRTFPLDQGEFSKAQRPLRLDAFEHYIRGLHNADEAAQLRELNEAVRLEPEWPDPAFALGQASFEKRDCPAAATWFSRVPKTHERYVQAAFSTGVCRLWMNDPGAAVLIFAQLQDEMRTDPGGEGAELPEILNNLAIARSRAEKAPLAEDLLRHAADLDPDDDDYPFNLGLLAFRGGDFAGAAAQFREAIQRDSGDGEARALLILSLERGGQKSEAEAERAAAKETPGAGPLPPIKLESLARLDRIKTELDEAALLQNSSVAQSHADGAAQASSADAAASPALAHGRRGRQELAAGRLAEAEREYRAALAANSRDSFAHRGLADVLRRQGHLGDAVAELRSSLAIRDSAVAHTALAKLYLELKNPELARPEIERALVLAPNYTEAKQLLERLQPSKPGGATP